jgi:uncharacterized protein involved in outer membrane biogenesis
MPKKPTRTRRRPLRTLGRFLLYVLGGVTALLAVLVLAAIVFVNQAGYKPQIEAAASDALDMDVELRGWLSIGFFPEPHVVLNDVRVSNHGSALVSAKAINIGIDVVRLFDGDIRLGKIVLKQPRILIERDAKGHYNFEQTDKASTRTGRIPAFSFRQASIVDGKIIHQEMPSGDRIEAAGCNLDVNDLTFRGGRSVDLPKRLGFGAELSCRTLRTKKLVVSNLTLTATAKNGIVDLKPIALRLYGGTGSGNVRANLTNAVRRVDVDYRVTGIQLGQLLNAVAPGKNGKGTIDFLMLLNLQGKTANEMKRSMKGAASILGDNLTINGTDLDQQITLFEDSQSFDLVDAGAFFIVSPFAIVATKGYDFASIFRDGSGTTKVQRLVSDWIIDRGVARAHDVALATKKHRIALRGRLNFVTERYEGIAIAVLNPKGCSIVQQTIRGSFDNPVIDRPGIFKTLTAPIVKLFKMGSCKVFYAGTVAAPL